jgi:type IV pilus secretin PilQ/predicted competence protein
MKKSIALTLALVFASFGVQAVYAQQAAKPAGPKVDVVNENYGEPAKAKPAPANAAASSLYKRSETVSPLDRKVTIRVNNVPIGTFLNSISAQSKINFIMGEEFSGKKISASLTNVTVREALDTLLRVQGLTYQRVGKSDSYVITNRSEEAPNTVTRVYTLNYVSLQPNTSIPTDLNSIMPADVTSSSFGSGSGTSFNIFDNASAGGSSSIAPTTGGSGSAITQGNGASAILGVIQSVLTKQGKIAVDSRTNKLIITDVPEVFPQIESILEELDVKAPQILIEAQVIEVSKGSGYDVGFNWNINGEFTGGSTEMPWDYFGASRNSANSFLKYFGLTPNWTVDPTTGERSRTIGGSIPKLSWENTSIVFQALMTTNEARALGKPKVITMNNNPAMVTSSRDASVGKITRDTGSGSSGTTTTSGNERKRVGLTLNVTPQVNKEGYVTLTVLPSYSDLVPSETGGDSYDTITRAVTTQVRVKSGQTVVLGGLLQSSEKESVYKVPLLGQIPVIGWLFTSKSKRKSTTDLVIFITPTVLSE